MICIQLTVNSFNCGQCVCITCFTLSEKLFLVECCHPASNAFLLILFFFQVNITSMLFLNFQLLQIATWYKCRFSLWTLTSTLLRHHSIPSCSLLNLSNLVCSYQSSNISWLLLRFLSFCIVLSYFIVVKIKYGLVELKCIWKRLCLLSSILIWTLVDQLLYWLFLWLLILDSWAEQSSFSCLLLRLVWDWLVVNSEIHNAGKFIITANEYLK